MENQQFFLDEAIKMYFNLRQSKLNKPTIIYLVINISGIRIKISTNVKIYPQQWNYKQQKAIISPHLTELDNHNNTIVNNKLNECIVAFHEAKSYLCQNIISLNQKVDIIKKHIYKVTMSKKTNKEKEPLHWIYRRLEEKTIKESSKLTEYRILKSFKEYLEINNIYLDNWEKFTLELLISYREFLKTKINRQGKYDEVSTRNQKIKKIIEYAKSAEKEGLIDLRKNRILLYEFEKDLRGRENQIVLKESEIKAMIELKLNGDKEQIRDLFIFQYYTGQRFSDIQQITKDIIKEYKGKKYCVIKQKKTGKSAEILLHPQALEILEKYDFKLPNIDIYKCDRDIKIIAKEAGITGREKIIEQRGHEIHEINKERWELVATHTSRRSFVTNSIAAGVAKIDTQRQSGHTTENSLNTYIKNGDGIFIEKRIDREIEKEIREKSPNIEFSSATIDKLIDEAKKKFIQDAIDEAKEVLTMLGAPAYEFQNIYDIETLHRLMSYKYESKLLDAGIDIKTVKEIYNTREKTLFEKVNAIQELYKEAINKAE